MNKNLEPLPSHDYLKSRGWRQNLGWKDYIFALLVILGSIYAQFGLAGHRMDYYEISILWGSAVGLIALCWFFKPLQWFSVATCGLAWLGLQLYAGHIDNNNVSFFLKYFLSSQSAIMWLCVLTFLSFFAYLFGTIFSFRADKKTGAVNSNNTLLSMGTAFAWLSALFGMVGLLVRWHESYLLRPDAGHMPVSNLYEVFILFMVITTLMYLYYAIRFNAQRLGAFVFAFQCVVVIFVLWYMLARDAHHIQPLIPALQSWWMKIHVPTNFVGYGAFCMAAALGVAELLAMKYKWKSPSAEVIDEIMYKAIAIGFLFFTIATVLGALWAADAWGRYWSWDPKETWAFIVWLNYAIWLHLRLVKGWRGAVLAWWAIIGLFITAFAFLGVNMFLSGLHSYGAL